MAIARELLHHGGYISVQALNELTSVALGKLNVPWPKLLMHITDLRIVCEAPLPITLAIHEQALALAQRYRYHIYDSLMLASALNSGCKTLYSEDMQDGQTIDSLTIRNPFKT